MANIVQLGRAVLDLAMSRGLFDLEAAAREMIPIIRIIWWLLEQSSWAAKIERLFPLISPMDDTEAMEQLQRDLDRNEQRKKDNEEEDNKHVIKIKDAMEAVNNHIGVGTELIAFVKQLIAVIAQGSGQAGISRISEEIRKEMLENTLRQDRPRVKKDKKGWFRPGARG